MAREVINDLEVEQVTGGSIVFNGAHTTCGHNCNDQYSVHDYDGCQDFIRANCTRMSEKQMLSKMLEKGLISYL